MFGMISLFTAQSEYALSALVELALRPRGTTTRSPDLARRLGISAASMEQVMVRLRRHGLLRSVRGARGGYALAKPAEQISVCDVLQVFVPTRREPRPDPPDRPTRLAVRAAVEGLEAEVLDRTGKMRVSELAEASRRQSDVMAIMPGL